MTEKLQALAARFDELEARLAAPGLYDDPQNAAALLREHDRLAPIAAAAHALQAARQAQEEAREMLSDPELKALAQEELAAAKAEIERLSSEVKLLLVPRDPNDDKNVIVEIRGGAGGEESALFAHSLYRMYTMYAEKQGWSVDVLSQSPTELGGCKEIIFQVSGDGAYSRLKFESGVHRVQRVPETESQGRVHTSTVTVAVLPEAEEVDFEIDPADLKIDTFRSSGAGGQHINKTESAIRITHLPTGVVVECQDERSQHKNRDKAMRVLRTRLFEAEQARQNAAIAAERRSQVGTGDRSERIRTYNFPENRVSDHRIKLTLYKLADFMDGALDEVIEGLAAAERVRLMEEGGS
ncbi:MAG: peptide chain release factor 1 [Clostridiaceae bacterium]|nr:peptide chain release factor 1 [Clostridiaceae bacterium]MCI9484964.1 peptide chain release factor 1 [Clostridiaceae bacterium]NBH78792.1 peptide chain release factor 1 [Clostridiaceae bacterium]